MTLRCDCSTSFPRISPGDPAPVSYGSNSLGAAAAKSLQSCPTLCYPVDGSPPGSPVPGILQARTLEWVAISFSNAWKWKVKVKSPSHVRLLATPWTAAYRAPPSMGFSRQEYWSGVPFSSLCTRSAFYWLPSLPPFLYFIQLRDELLVLESCSRLTSKRTKTMGAMRRSRVFMELLHDWAMLNIWRTWCRMSPWISDN